MFVCTKITGLLFNVHVLLRAVLQHNAMTENTKMRRIRTEHTKRTNSDTYNSKGDTVTQYTTTVGYIYTQQTFSVCNILRILALHTPDNIDNTVVTVNILHNTIQHRHPYKQLLIQH